MLSSFEGKVVAITGAGSGIGRALALELAKRGAHLALSDVDEEGLALVAKEIGQLAAGVSSGVLVASGDEAAKGAPVVSTRKVDVSDREQVRNWAAFVVAEHGRVNMIVNNAGVALGAHVAQMSYQDLEWLMGINFWGVVHGTKEFLPYLEASGEGHIVNLSSVFGLVGIPTQSAYVASKFAVRGFSESLQIELASAKSCVSCSCVHPGGVKTAIARNARVDPGLASLAGGEEAAKASFEKIFITSPEKAARKILQGVAHNRQRILVGPDAPLFLFLSLLPVGAYQRIVARASARLARS
jgi:NAD(P)-dependent dehydrogenase (short-subunit alcohol dehydrogenase family)